MWRRPGSVRVRTTLAATVLTALVLTLGSVLIVQLVERNLLDSAHADATESADPPGHETDSKEGDESGLSEASIREVQEGVDAVTGALVLIVPGLLLLLGAGTWVMVGRALRPVRAITDRVTTITSTTLDERVPQPGSNDEIDELATVMNEMLDRLEEGSERQRQFIADASHELRSPLSTIKAAAEITRVSPDPGRLGQLASEIEAEADRMEDLIADLLDLARFDEQRPAGSGMIVALGAVCEKAINRLPETDIDVSVSDDESLSVLGVESQIERAVFNLVLNATDHAARWVHLAVRRRDRRAVVVVDDDGNGVPAEDRRRIFDRFVRLDRSRGRDTGGSGLGLALVRAIASRQGGTVSVIDAPGGGARFVLDLGPVERPPTVSD